MSLIDKYLGEAAKPKVDLRKNYDEVVKINSTSDKSKGMLYRKGNVTQVWWETDALGRKMKNPQETWTAPDAKQAKREFKDMKARFNEGNYIAELARPNWQSMLGGQKLVKGQYKAELRGNNDYGWDYEIWKGNKRIKKSKMRQFPNQYDAKMEIEKIFRKY